MGGARLSLLVSPPPDEMVADPVYAQLKRYVIESTGLAYYADKDADLTRRIRRRLTTFGTANCAGYLEVLRDVQEDSDANAALDRHPLPAPHPLWRRAR